MILYCKYCSVLASGKISIPKDQVRLANLLVANFCLLLTSNVGILFQRTKCKLDTWIFYKSSATPWLYFYGRRGRKPSLARKNFNVFLCCSWMVNHRSIERGIEWGGLVILSPVFNIALPKLPQIMRQQLKDFQRVSCRFSVGDLFWC